MKKSRKLIVVFSIVIIILSLTGCSMIKDMIGTKEGQLIGQEFEISSYDHYGSKTLLVSGDKVTVGLLENSANFKVEDSGYKSDVLEITVNGNQMLQVGNTVIFAEKGLDMVEDYEVPEEIQATTGGGFVPFDRFVNDIKNKIGKEKIIIVSSQMGMPIGVFQGRDVYVTVPDNLPKMTRLNIDGKSLYIHRANYVILDSKMIN